MNNIDSKWANFGGSVGTRLLLTTAFSPFEYAKTLIQIGFEPIPPKPTTTLLGKPALGLPNVFTYVKYIHNVDGTVGCFRGLTPRLCSTFLTTVSHSYVIDKFKIPESAVDERELTEEDRQTLFAKTLSREIFATTTAIIISQPFHVVAVRMMGQFVGRETKYDGVISSLWSILIEEGFWGLFSGLTPRLIGEVTTVFLVSSATFAINTYLVPEDKSLQQMFGVGVDFLVKNITYPFHVVGACMTINSSGLRAGSPPLMPNYSHDWMACWRDLKSANQLKRGSGLIWRYHIPPKAVESTSFLTPMPKISRRE